MKAPVVLVVDDEPDIRGLVKEILEDEGLEVCVAENGESARRAWRARHPDLVLLDIWMPDIDGITLLREWSDEGGHLASPVIMMSGHGTVETAVEATRLGAYDFVEKPLSLAKLLLTVKQALESRQLGQGGGARRTAQGSPDPVGRSAVMQRLREQVRQAAETDTAVLFNGEIGTGRGFLARYLHGNSRRQARSFVTANAAWLESADPAVLLFGFEEGETVRPGLLEQATRGTLLIEQVFELSPDTQAKLEGALTARRIYRVGGTTPVDLDVRMVATSDVNLESEVREGRFREALYYHLAETPFLVPPLREHCEDVPELLAYFVNTLVTEEALTYRNFSVAAQNRLRNYDWPGNIRELKSMARRLLLLGNGAEIGLYEINTLLENEQNWTPSDNALKTLFDLPLREAREQFEKAYLMHQLKIAGGSVGNIAKQTGMERTHLYRKLRSLGIDIKQGKAK